MPAVSTAELIARLAKGKPISAITLIGADTYLLDASRKALADTFVDPGLREWALHRLSADNEPVESIIGHAQSLPMLAPRQLLFVEDVEAWQGKADPASDSGEENSSAGKGIAPSNKGDDERKQSIAKLAAYLDDPAPFTTIVFEAAALDKRMSLFKTLSEKTLVVEVKLPDDERDRARIAPTVMATMARELGVEVEPAAAAQLADMLNFELGRIHTELQKLTSYVGARKRITAADVDALVLSEKKYSVWELSDLLASGDSARALRFLDRLLRDGEQPPALVGAITWMYRKLLMASEVRGAPNKFALAGKLGMNPDMAERAVLAARRIPRARLVSGMQALYDADSRLKSSNSNPRAVLEFLLSRLSSR